MVCLYMILSFVHLVIFSGKPKNCEIQGSCRENPDNIGIFFYIEA